MAKSRKRRQKSKRKTRAVLDPGVRTPKTPEYVIVELRHDSRIAYSASHFEAPESERSAAKSLNDVLEQVGIPSPERRLKALEMLSSAGVPSAVMFAPIIPALNDQEMEEVLKQASAAGAREAMRSFTISLKGTLLAMRSLSQLK